MVDEDELKKVLSEIQMLYEEILDLEIDKDMKRVLLDMLKTMENAIHEYRIRGVERLHEAIEQLIGIYLVNQQVFKNSKVEEIGKVKELFIKFGNIYSLAADTIQLLGAGEVVKNTSGFITKLLSSGQ